MTDRDEEHGVDRRTFLQASGLLWGSGALQPPALNDAPERVNHDLGAVVSGAPVVDSRLLRSLHAGLRARGAAGALLFSAGSNAGHVSSLLEIENDFNRCSRARRVAAVLPVPVDSQAARRMLSVSRERVSVAWDLQVLHGAEVSAQRDWLAGVFDAAERGLANVIHLRGEALEGLAALRGVAESFVHLHLVFHLPRPPSAELRGQSVSLGRSIASQVLGREVN